MHDLCNNMYHTAGQIQDFRKGEEVLYASGPIPKEGGGGGGHLNCATESANARACCNEIHVSCGFGSGA